VVLMALRMATGSYTTESQNLGLLFAIKHHTGIIANIRQTVKSFLPDSARLDIMYHGVATYKRKKLAMAGNTPYG